jgi:hypothetical protein
MSYETRAEMKTDLTQIAVTRRQMSVSITNYLLNNFTSLEIALIAKELKIGNYYKLIDLIKR